MNLVSFQSLLFESLKWVSFTKKKETTLVLNGFSTCTCYFSETNALWI